MDTEADPVVHGLRKLREGRGLTAGRLEQAGAVLSALGTSDPELGLARLLAALTGLGEGERFRALRVDFGLGLPDLLERAPSSREIDWLGERRAGYAEVIGRGVKTLARWSDQAVRELRAQLISDTFTGDLFVVAAVEGDRILGCNLIRKEVEADGRPLAEHETVEVENDFDHPSLPVLIYAYPRDWRPRSLSLAVAFRGSRQPTEVWAIVAESVFDLSFAARRQPLTEDDGVFFYRVDRPRTDLLYAITWA